MLEAGNFLTFMTLPLPFIPVSCQRMPNRFPGIAAGVCLFAGLLLGGCNQAASSPPTPDEQARAKKKQDAQAWMQKENVDRTEVNAIPPPSKGRYLAVHTEDGWSNPFLTVHRDTVELRIMFPPTAGSPLDGGSSLLHPAAARKQTLDLRLADLPDALAAIPSYAWPYGRVVAVQESEAAKRQDRAQVRRTEESTMQMLNDLGVVVDEWTGTNNSLLH